MNIAKKDQPDAGLIYVMGKKLMDLPYSLNVPLI